MEVTTASDFFNAQLLYCVNKNSLALLHAFTVVGKLVLNLLLTLKIELNLEIYYPIPPQLYYPYH